MSERSDDNGPARRFHGDVDEPEIEFTDDFLFEPNAWDLASTIGLEADADTDRDALDELADAMLVWADSAETEQLTDRAVEALWSDELEGAIREGLARVAALGDEWASACGTALVALDQSGLGAPVTRAVVQHLAMQLGSADHPVFFCLDCLDQAVKTAPAQVRRELALGAAIVAARNAAVPDAELRSALAGAPLEPPVLCLATDTRRQAVRTRLGRIGELGRKSMPTLAGELRMIAVEVLPARAEDDDVWHVACGHLVEQKVRPHLN